ncbi:hypothetical protein [Micromonospora coriariae]|uniref:hypothetical protein n=1 Tax=Micromonospora coriariae TaxID=285665 RepID=UPI0012FE30C0|nr:hypothetical protein [Micromonospora coriariae]
MALLIGAVCAAALLFSFWPWGLQPVRGVRRLEDHLVTIDDADGRPRNLTWRPSVGRLNSGPARG